jgi:hypothetical protein
LNGNGVRRQRGAQVQSFILEPCLAQLIASRAARKKGAKSSLKPTFELARALPRGVRVAAAHKAAPGGLRVWCELTKSNILANFKLRFSAVFKNTRARRSQFASRKLTSTCTRATLTLNF